jgi:hypothetical protein
MKEKEGYDAARESREAITDPARSPRHEKAMRTYLSGEAYARARGGPRRRPGVPPEPERKGEGSGPS